MSVATPSPGGENREQDLLCVAVEIQRILEASGYKPMSATDVGKALSMQSHMLLLQHSIGLLGVISAHQKLYKLTDVDGCQMVSLNGVPWLGPSLPPGASSGCTPSRCSPMSGACGDPQAGIKNSSIMQGLPRGKALEMMGELAEMPAVQVALHEIAQLLFVAPQRTLLVSEVGSRITQNTRSLLRSVKLRVAQLLQCFPNDFALSGQGPATAATYCHSELRAKFAPRPSIAELNSGRYYRLLKLGSDITERFDRAKSISCRDVHNSRSTMIFVDCRSEVERSISVIANSIPQSQVLEADLAEVQLVVAYCCVGAHSAEWCQAQADGMWAYKIRFLAGGVAAWAHSGGAFADPMTMQPVMRVHCWVKEMMPFFPVPGAGYDIVLTAGVPLLTREALVHPSDMRHARLRNLAWEVRLKYWPSVFCIEAADLKTQIALGHGPFYLLVDCRTLEERQVSTLAAPGSVVIPADELRRRAPEYVNAFDTIITFCTIGGRSGMFCKRLVDELIEYGHFPEERSEELRRKIVNMLGGMAAWLHNKGALVDCAGRPTYQFHPWCQAFLDMFPLEDLELLFDENRPVPHDALSLAACGSNATGAGENMDAMPQRLLQMCSVLPPEVINDSLTRAMQSCSGYED